MVQLSKPKLSAFAKLYLNLMLAYSLHDETHEFRGWYTDAECKTQPYDFNQGVTKDYNFVC